MHGSVSCTRARTARAASTCGNSASTCAPTTPVSARSSVTSSPRSTASASRYRHRERRLPARRHHAAVEPAVARLARRAARPVQPRRIRAHQRFRRDRIRHAVPAPSAMPRSSARHRPRRRRGPMLVMGPGTGLGAAVLLPGEHHPTVISTEAGQVAFAPTTDLEIEILKMLRTRMTHVSIENVVSGPGSRERARRAERDPCRAPALPHARGNFRGGARRPGAARHAGARSLLRRTGQRRWPTDAFFRRPWRRAPRWRYAAAHEEFPAPEQLPGALPRHEPDAQPPGTRARQAH